MKKAWRATPRRQRGATLIVALIMIVLMSLIAVGAFNLTSSNLKSVGNLQARNEALAAANNSIEQVISGSFLTALNTTATFTIDVDKNGAAEYTVNVAIPQCPVRVQQTSVAQPSDVELAALASAGTYGSEWEFRATVSDTVTGAALVMRQGVRVPLSEADYKVYVEPCGLTL